jgi:hypothetical protein
VRLAFAARRWFKARHGRQSRFGRRLNIHIA